MNPKNQKLDKRAILKEKIKDYVRKQMKEISASGAAGGGVPGDGSAGPIKTPYAFGKTKKATADAGGYTPIEKSKKSNNKGVNLMEKEKTPSMDKSTEKKSEPYKPIVAAKPKTAEPSDKFADQLATGVKQVFTKLKDKQKPKAGAEKKEEKPSTEK